MRRETNPFKWKIFEHQLFIVVGLGEVLGGFLLITVSSLLPFRVPPSPQWLLDILSNLGIGLVAAGIATGTIEAISRKRLQHDIAEMKEAHFESILKGFIPTPIFEEIKTQIIAQPFLRRDFNWAFEFTWEDEERKFIHKYHIVDYEVKNVSQTLEKYELLVIEERTREEFDKKIEYIKKIEVQRNGEENPHLYLPADLEKYTEKAKQYIRISKRLPLNPNESIRVRILSENILPSRDVYVCASAKMSEHFELTVAHPVDLDVQAMAMHPSRNRFKTEVETPRLKRWRIDTGVLPYQGIELSWRPVEAKDLVLEGFGLFSQRKYSQARLRFKIALKIYIGEDEKEEISKTQEIIEKCSKALDAEAAYEKGMEYYTKEEYDNAITKFQVSKSLYEEIGEGEGSQHAQSMIENCHAKRDEESKDSVS